MVPSPDGSLVAITNHQFQLFVVAVANGERKLADESAFGRIEGPAWSPDGKWVAYSYPASAQTRNIKLGDVDGGTTFSVTSPEYRDSCPSFDPTGTYLYFLSQRTFDPVYDSLFFDLGFPLGAKPYLVTLQSSTASPFVVRPDPEQPPASHHDGRDNGATEPSPSSSADEPVRVDLEGIEQRVVEVPVPEARYESIIALKNKLLLLSRPVHGSLERNFWDGSPFPDGLLEYYDLVEDRRETLLTEVADVVVSGDRTRLAYTTSGPDEEYPRRLRVVAASEKPDEERAKEPPGRRSGFVDLGRVRVLVDPGAEWGQMLREAWRLQPDHFWTGDLSGVDWPRVLDRYLPLVERVATRAELSDLIWELQGELGTSHCYEVGGEYRKAPPWGLAHLGAHLVRDASGRWVVARLARGSSWYPKEAVPLQSPGSKCWAGDGHSGCQWPGCRRRGRPGAFAGQPGRFAGGTDRGRLR